VSSAVTTGFRVIALAIAAMLLLPGAASAQAWPSRPVTMVVPFPAGGTADLFAREIAQALSDELGQPFVVENRAGGGGNPAAAAIARVAPDGLTLLFASQAQAALNKFMYRSLPYDPARDLAPIVLAIKSSIALIAGIDAPVKSFGAMVDYAKANPGKLSVGQAGTGSMGHVAFELLQQKAGITLNAVPYKGFCLHHCTERRKVLELASNFSILLYSALCCSIPMMRTLPGTLARHGSPSSRRST
jgi:tripartite-type tricarboxylate transporter receptor subunit TctC